MTDVTWIVIGLAITVLGVFFGVVRPWLTAKLQPEQLVLLRAFAKIAVNAAEQIIELTTGEDKKAFAMKQVKKLLAKFHLTFDEDTVSTAIEDQVYEMNKKKEAE